MGKMKLKEERSRQKYPNKAVILPGGVSGRASKNSKMKIRQKDVLCFLYFFLQTIFNYFMFSLFRTASPVIFMKFSPDGEFFATAGKASDFYKTLLKPISIFFFLRTSQ